MHTPETPALALGETGLICGFRVGAGPPRELQVADVAAALRAAEGVHWLHFSLANTRVAHFLAESPLVPAPFRGWIAERDARPRIGSMEDGLLLAMTDLEFDAHAPSAETAMLWAYATPRLVVTARSHAVSSTDALRKAVREGLALENGIALVTNLFTLRMEALEREVERLGEDVHDIEDRILSGEVAAQRERLGRVRRQCARIRRHFIHDRVALQRFVAHPPAWLGAGDLARLQRVAEDFGFLLDEYDQVYERAKLLQEELAALVAERTGARLYVLSVLSAVLLPMTLVTGVFGMNVAGVPGVPGGEGDPAAFWWTMLAVAVAGIGMLAFLRLRKLL
jgi:zinc transporter